MTKNSHQSRYRGNVFQHRGFPSSSGWVKQKSLGATFFGMDGRVKLPQWGTFDTSHSNATPQTTREPHPCLSFLPSQVFLSLFVRKPQSSQTFTKAPNFVNEKPFISLNLCVASSVWMAETSLGIEV